MVGTATDTLWRKKRLRVIGTEIFTESKKEALSCKSLGHKKLNAHCKQLLNTQQYHVCHARSTDLDIDAHKEKKGKKCC